MVWDVEAAEWMCRLSDEAILAATDEGSFQRGVDYAERGMVTQAATLNRGRVVVARVTGSGSETYQTIVSRHGDARDDVIEWSARCSCPVGTECKHAVAVILTVREMLGGPADADAARPWEDALALLAADPGPKPLEEGRPVALIIEQAETSGFTVRPGRRVRVRPTRRVLSGAWAKKYTWNELDHANQFTAAGVREDHRRAVRELQSLHRVRTGVSRYAYGPSPDVHLDDLGPEAWPTLRRVQAAGVELIGSVAGEPVELLDTPLDVALDVTAVDEGLLLRTVVSGVDPDAEVQLIGDPAHGALWVEEGEESTVRLAPFAAEISPEVTEVIRSGRDIVVPESDVERFVTLYLPRLRERVTVTSSDESVDLPQPEPPRLHLHVAREGRGVRLDLGFAYTAGERTHVVAADERGAVPRDSRAEAALIGDLDPLADLPGALIRAPRGWQLRTPLRLQGLRAFAALTDVVPHLEGDPRCVVVVDDDVPSFEELDAEPEVVLHPAGESGSDWLDLHVSVTVGDVEVPFEPLFAALVRGDEVMQLDSGEWFRLDHPVLTDLRELILEARELVEPEAGELRLSRYQVDLFDDLSDLAEIQLEREHAWRASVETLRELETRPAPEPPSSLEATLRPYQLEGYHWLTTLWDARLGGVLADDMGLGKTVQTLALLARAAEAGELDRPVLVVAPTSVVGTWVAEARTFVPDLDVRALTSTHRRRGSSVTEAVAGAQLVVTSYAVLRIDAEQFAEVDWSGLVLDEAQFVKNDRSKTHQALRRLSAPFVLAVTGTPLENSLMDLWSLLALAAPGLYPRRDRFGEAYRKPIESGERPELLDRLRRRIRPLMLRRTKEQVALDLPPKQVQVVPVDLAPTHRRVYDRHLQRERKRVLGLMEDPDANRVAILASLTRLRQLSLDPALVDEDLPGQRSSAKIDVLVEHLRELAVEGHRALVFSQFTGFLGIVRERLQDEGISTSYLDGATTHRAEVIDGFKQGEQTAFLISLKAGGVGLTLTEADYVFVLDPWWNPAAEAQAIDRAHRIGQDQPVMVYRLVSAGTIEDKVLALQERKRDLFERVVDDGGALSGAITSADIRALLGVED